MNVDLERLIKTTRRRRRRRLVLSSAPLAGTTSLGIGHNERTMPKRGARVLGPIPTETSGAWSSSTAPRASPWSATAVNALSSCAPSCSGL